MYIKTILISQYTVVYTAAHFWIGCMQGTIGKWKEFENRIESKIDLKLWKKHKLLLTKIIKEFPAKK